MNHINIDLETYCDLSLKKCGLYKYVESSSFQILLFSYSINFGEVHCIDFLAGERLSEDLVDILLDPNYIKHAHNASFEMAAINKYLSLKYVTKKLDPSQWVDTMALAAIQGLPLSLKDCGEVLGLGSDKAKDSAGKALIAYFTKPCKPTKANGGRKRNYPLHDLDKWEAFKRYNMQDVRAESEIYKILSDTWVTPKERELFLTDHEINVHGVQIDIDLVNQIIKDDSDQRDLITQRAKDLTGLDNPNSPKQLLEWLKNRRCYLDDLTKETVEGYLKKPLAGNLDPKIKEVLQIRLALSKTSIKKFYTAQEAMCEDHRLRGILQYYGARTGRWAGKLVQVHNLKRNSLPNLDSARTLAKSGNVEALEFLYGDLSETHSQLCRTIFVPKKGKKFIVADFSAIEARVLAWMAGEQWILDTFISGRDLYCEQASRMFKVPVTKTNENHELRQKGKIAILACGYGGGAGALKKMGADKMGLSTNEVNQIIKEYRSSNKNIVAFWGACERAAMGALMLKSSKTVGSLIFAYEIMTGRRPVLTIKLPSGRKLYYQNPHTTTNRFGSQALAFDTMDSESHRWQEEETYGGKLVENIIQAIARDCLAETLFNLRGYENEIQVVMHIHDEVVCEADESFTVDQICALMGQPIDWAPGLPLSAAGFEGYYYKKD